MTPDLVAALNALDSAVLGSRIRAARQALSLTQPELATDDISVAYLSRIERGERRPGPELLERLCGRLGLTPESIIRGFDQVDLRRLELDLEYAELALATGDAQRALDSSRTLGENAHVAAEPSLSARAALIAADALASLGLTADAVTAYEEVLSARPSSADWPLAAIALSRLLRELGDLRRSASVAEEALLRLQNSDLRGGEEAVRLTVTLAATLFEIGEVGRATLMCQQAITAAESLGSERARAAAYWNSSVIEAEAGNIDRALKLARTALMLLEGREDSRSIARLRTQLAEILLRTEPAQLTAALEQLNAAAEEYRWVNASESERMHTQVTLARARFMSGDVGDAAAIARAVLETVDDLPFVSISAAILLGQTSFASGDIEAAHDFYAAAIATLTSIGADRQAAQIWFDLANLLDEAGMTGEANDAYRRAAAASGFSTRANPFTSSALSVP